MVRVICGTKVLCGKVGTGRTICRGLNDVCGPGRDGREICGGTNGFCGPGGVKVGGLKVGGLSALFCGGGGSGNRGGVDLIGLIADGAQATLMFTVFQTKIQSLMIVVMKIGDHGAITISISTKGPMIQEGSTKTRMPSTNTNSLTIVVWARST